MEVHWFPHWRSIEAGGGYIKSVTLADHEQALAEKDAQIEMMLSIQDNQADLIERKDLAYQQLMANAVRFAEWIVNDPDYYMEIHVIAKEFLASTEVQIWKEHKP